MAVSVPTTVPFEVFLYAIIGDGYTNGIVWCIETLDDKVFLNGQTPRVDGSYADLVSGLSLEV